MRAVVVLLFAASPVFADEYKPVSDKSAFIDLVSGKELRNGLYDISLQVDPSGEISGEALGWQITGSWSWKDGYFCREMDWEGYAIPYNCQLVEAQSDRQLRFTVDRGAGDSAAFRLR